MLSFPGKPPIKMSPLSTDDVCPICLCSIYEEFSRPENCQHRFDLECLTEWSKLRLSCPSCRSTFEAVYSYKIVGNKPVLQKVQKMEKPVEAEPFDEADPLDFTICEICSGGMHEELLLICDQCDKGFHTYCLTPPLDSVPTTEQWFCPQCEELRISLPSTSHRAPSARTTRLVQRTALAERVRRVLARNRQLIEDDDDDDDDDSDESDEVVLEDEDEGEDKVSIHCSEEESIDFSNDDARVLGEAHFRTYGATSLPSVKRRPRRKRRTKKLSKKIKEKKVSKKSGKGKRRRNRLKSKRNTKGENQSNFSKLRRLVHHEPVIRLSLLGAELEPVADPLVTENSRRFDQPLTHRKELFIDEKPIVDSCDLLGSIIPEQIKTLAPGRLFAVKGGRFNCTESFEKYKIKKTNQLSSELRERLGITSSTDRLSSLATVTRTPVVKYPNDRKHSPISNVKRQEGLILNEVKKIECNDQYIEKLNPEKQEVLQCAQHIDRAPSTAVNRHQNFNNGQNLPAKHSIRRCVTDKYRQVDAHNHGKIIKERETHANVSGNCQYQGQQDQHLQCTMSRDPFSQELGLFRCNTSEYILKNEESEQEDRVSSTKVAVDAKAISGRNNYGNIPMCEYQSTSLDNLVVKDSLEAKMDSICSSRDRKQNADDILRIIDGFAKEGIKPYKREITVQDYKDVMRAVVRECYKKKILDGNTIKDKVRQHIASIKESASPLFTRNSFERTDSNRCVEFTLPPKRLKLN